MYRACLRGVLDITLACDVLARNSQSTYVSETAKRKIRQSVPVLCFADCPDAVDASIVGAVARRAVLSRLHGCADMAHVDDAFDHLLADLAAIPVRVGDCYCHFFLVLILLSDAVDVDCPAGIAGQVTAVVVERIQDVPGVADAVIESIARKRRLGMKRVNALITLLLLARAAFAVLREPRASCRSRSNGALG